MPKVLSKCGDESSISAYLSRIALQSVKVGSISRKTARNEERFTRTGLGKRACASAWASAWASVWASGWARVTKQSESSCDEQARTSKPPSESELIKTVEPKWLRICFWFTFTFLRRIPFGPTSARGVNKKYEFDPRPTYAKNDFFFCVFPRRCQRECLGMFGDVWGDLSVTAGQLQPIAPTKSKSESYHSPRRLFRHCSGKLACYRRCDVIEVERFAFCTFHLV